MPKIIKSVLCTILFLCSQNVFAQFEFPTKSVAGTVRLDYGVAEIDYSITVTLAARSISVSPDPLVGVTYPILDLQTQTITIPKGQSVASYSVAVDSLATFYFSLRFDCNTCGGVIATQYYAPGGNEFSLNNVSALRDEELPSTVNFVLESEASIAGRVSLAEGALAKKELLFNVLAVAPSDKTFVLGQTTISILAGQNTSPYILSGLTRYGEPNYLVLLECLNCSGGEVLLEFPQILSASENHTGIDFEITINNSGALPAIVQLLLNDS